MKCEVCGKKIELTFLGKLVGTYMRNKKAKKKPVCSSCQKAHSKDELLEKI